MYSKLGAAELSEQQLKDGSVEGTSFMKGKETTLSHNSLLHLETQSNIGILIETF